jgi:predicted transcriptional regulator
MWYHSGHPFCMAMTLRLDEQETDALRQRAEREGRSMQEVARQAVRDDMVIAEAAGDLDDVEATAEQLSTHTTKGRG